MVIFTVYKITCLLNQKNYIGYTKNNIETRLKEHFKTANNRKNTKNKFSNAILKYGKHNFIVESLYQTLFKDDALEKEILFIKEFKSNEIGYNSTLGGECGGKKGRKLSKEHKEKLRIANKNKIVSEETKKLISKNHANVSGEKNPFYKKNHSEKTKKKIASRYYPTGKEHHLYGKKISTAFKEGINHPKSQKIIINNIEYGSISLASKALKISRQTIKKRYL